MFWKDSRIKLMNEVLNGIKVSENYIGKTNFIVIIFYFSLSLSLSPVTIIFIFIVMYTYIIHVHVHVHIGNQALCLGNSLQENGYGYQRQ